MSRRQFKPVEYPTKIISLITNPDDYSRQRWNDDDYQYPTRGLRRNAEIVLVCSVNDPAAQREIYAADCHVAEELFFPQLRLTDYKLIAHRQKNEAWNNKNQRYIDRVDFG